MPWPKNRPASVTEVVLAAYRKLPGGTSAEIAALAGVAPEYVRTVLNRKGLRLAHRPPPRPKRTTPVRPYRRLLDWERAAIAAAYADGEKLEAIAVEFGSKISTVYRVAMAEGVPQRDPFLSRRLKTKGTHPAARKADEPLRTLKKRLAEERKLAIAARAKTKGRSKRHAMNIGRLETADP